MILNLSDSALRDAAAMLARNAQFARQDRVKRICAYIVAPSNDRAVARGTYDHAVAARITPPVASEAQAIAIVAVAQFVALVAAFIF